MSDEFPIFFQQDPYLRKRIVELGLGPRALLNAMSFLGMSDLVQKKLILISSYNDLVEIIVHARFLKENS